MTSSQAFRPEWASAPGETIADLLAKRDILIDEFSRVIGLTPGEAGELLDGRTSITLSLARRLTRALGASVEFWMARDYQYREHVARLEEAGQEWLRGLPIADMIRFGWLRPVPHPSEETEACLDFFGVQSMTAWRQAYGGLSQMAAFRTSPAFDSRPGSIAVWLRRGEIEAGQIQTKPWDPAHLQERLGAVRRLSRTKDPDRFVPQLQKLCAEPGVAVTIVRTPAGCRASGAVRFLDTNKAIVQLSFRYLSDDHFWFTFFHEAGHLLLHRERIAELESRRGDTCGLLEGADPLSDDDEEEANEFAARALIPAEFSDAFQKLRTDQRSVLRFSRRIGVSPGIVVGQLQHSKRIARNRLNGLKRRYRWND